MDLEREWGGEESRGRWRKVQVDMIKICCIHASHFQITTTFNKKKVKYNNDIFKLVNNHLYTPAAF